MNELPSQKGIFVTVDGIDGAGSTTIAKYIVKSLKKKGFKAIYTKEPTNTHIGKILRKDLELNFFSPQVEALLFAADRLVHLNKEIIPALKDNFIVVSDRYVESSICYQSAQGIDINWVKEVNKFAFKPHLTLILDISPSTAKKRKKGFGKAKFEKLKFLEKVRENFKTRALEEGYLLIDAEQPLEEVKKQVKIHVLTKIWELKGRKSSAGSL